MIARNVPRHVSSGPLRMAKPAHIVNAASARSSVTVVVRRRSVAWRVSSPPAAITFTSQKPATVTSPSATGGPPVM
jgi:hypothetical protein